MKIQLKKNGLVGEILVPSGDYLVSAHPELNQIKLVGRGKEYGLPANRRAAKSKSRVAQVSFFSMGGPTWTLAITTPPQGEWFVFITLAEDKVEAPLSKR